MLHLGSELTTSDKRVQCSGNHSAWEDLNDSLWTKTFEYCSPAEERASSSHLVHREWGPEMPNIALNGEETDLTGTGWPQGAWLENAWKSSKVPFYVTQLYEDAEHLDCCVCLLSGFCKYALPSFKTIFKSICSFKWMILTFFVPLQFHFNCLNYLSVSMC